MTKNNSLLVWAIIAIAVFFLVKPQLFSTSPFEFDDYSLLYDLNQKPVFLNSHVGTNTTNFCYPKDVVISQGTPDFWDKNEPVMVPGTPCPTYTFKTTGAGQVCDCDGCARYDSRTGQTCTYSCGGGGCYDGAPRGCYRYSCTTIPASYSRGGLMEVQERRLPIADYIDTTNLSGVNGFKGYYISGNVDTDRNPSTRCYGIGGRIGGDENCHRVTAYNVDGSENRDWGMCSEPGVAYSQYNCYALGGKWNDKGTSIIGVDEEFYYSGSYPYYHQEDAAYANGIANGAFYFDGELTIKKNLQFIDLKLVVGGEAQLYLNEQLVYSNSGTEKQVVITQSKIRPGVYGLEISGIPLSNTFTVPDSVVRLKIKVNNRKGYIKNIKYKYTFNCRQGPGDLLGIESFAGPQDISIYSTRYPIKSFCLEHPVIITSGTHKGSTATAEPYNKLVTGQTMIIPSDQTWTLFYVFNAEAAGIPTVCEVE